MDLLYSIAFYIIWIIFGWIVAYFRAYYRYQHKENVDKAYKERKEFAEKNSVLELEIVELEENLKKTKKELESTKREVLEKNKYISEDKVILERLAEVKVWINKISDTLEPYDKETIERLIQEAQKSKDFIERLNSKAENQENNTDWAQKKVWR